MPQSGFTPLQIYSSSTTTNVPTAGNLTNSTQGAELAINIADGKLFYKDSSGIVQVIGTKGGVGSSTTTQVLYNSSGLVVGSANLTFNGTTLTTANDASISGLTVGKGSGSINTNTALGSAALGANSLGVTGTSNTAVGANALWNITSGTDNTSIGKYSGIGLTTGSSNSSLGSSSLYSNTTGGSNVGIGASALYSNTTASNNTAVGYQAGYSGTTALNGTYLGFQAGYTNSTASSNVFVGGQAGYTSNGSYNTIVGQAAGYSLTTGTSNTFVGASGGANAPCGYYVTTGSNNTILGAFSGNQGGLDIRTASNYIVLSDGSGNPRGFFNSSGQFFVGTTTQLVSAVRFANFSSPASTDAVCASFRNNPVTSGTYNVLDVWAQETAGNSIFINFFTETSATVKGAISYNRTANLTAYGTTSDKRLKENIVDAPSALAKINSVKIRSFDWKETDSHSDFGVIAQELIDVAPECVVQGDNEQEIKKTWQVDTSALVPAMIKAIQELNATVVSLQAQVTALTKA